MEFNKGDIYEFTQTYDIVTSKGIVFICKGTRVKVVDNGITTIGLEFSQYIKGFHSCCGNTKTGHGYYFGYNMAEKLLKKVKTKKNNVEAYRDGV